ncbi:Rho GDP-dissociation inhibitor 1, partial [Mucuna pruriens]
MTVSFSVLFPNKKNKKKKPTSLSLSPLPSWRLFLLRELLSFFYSIFYQVGVFSLRVCVYLFLCVDGLLMSLAIAKDMGFDDKVKDSEGAGDDTDTSRVHAGHEESGDEGRGGTLSRHRSESSVAATEEEDDDEERKIELGPQCTLKEQLEKDKDDESLRRWKEQLLGSVDINSVGETLEPNVRILSLAIKTADRPDIVLAIPEGGNPKGLWFTLKEGSRYSLMFTFQVENNIVSGLKYTNTVWKTGLKVDSTKEMIGTFSPQAETYTHEMPEETTPSGMFARGTYTAKSKFVDDDNKCYLEINYTFDIRKEWQSYSFYLI